MSQKPRTGPQAKAGSPMKTALTQTAAKVAPVADKPVVKTKAVAEPATAPMPPPAAMPQPAVAVETEVEAALEESLAPAPVPPAIAAPAVPAPEPAAPEVTVSPVTVPAVTEPTAAAVNPAMETAPTMSETTQAMIETTTSAAETVAEKTEAAFTPSNPTISQGIKTMMKSTEDLVAFSQANIEAFVKSGQIWSAGVQELTKQFASSAKASFDESVSTFKAMSTCKSVKEAMDLQSSFAKAALEKAMAESNKLTDASIKLTEQTLAPITARVTVAVETFGKAA